MNIKTNTYFIPLAIVVAGLIIGGALIYLNQEAGSSCGVDNLPSSTEIAERTLKFINENILTDGSSASLVEIKEEGEIYNILIKIGETEYTSYVSKDGKFLFPQGYLLEEEAVEEGDTSSVEKSDVPDVKLFVMSYCPYGLQAQKMFLPVYDLLKDKAEMGIYFVDYIMHEKQEIDENLRQFCIQAEQTEKFRDYLGCFVLEGKTEECLNQVGIDRTQLNNCVAEADNQYNISSQYNDKNTWLNGRYPKFDVHSSLNDEYGVGGSPTLVINGKIVNLSTRSPEAFKKAICQAFNSAPAECSQSLSEESFSPGFGGGTGSSGSGSCQ